MEKETTKEDMGSGVAVGVFLFTVVVLFFFLSPPLFYLFDRWGGYWDDDGLFGEPTIKILGDEAKWGRRNAAFGDCSARSIAHYGGPKSASGSFASSTAEDWSSYDCYGTKYTLIP